MDEAELTAPARSVFLANKLLHSLHDSDLINAGFTEQDINDFGDFFQEVRYQAENCEQCMVFWPDEKDEDDEK